MWTGGNDHSVGGGSAGINLGGYRGYGERPMSLLDAAKATTQEALAVREADMRARAGYGAGDLGRAAPVEACDAMVSIGRIAAAAEPELEPPGVCSGCQGLAVGGGSR